MMSDLFVEAWGTGTRVVLVHGSLATGTEEWQAQRPLAEQGYQLLALDRRGYGKSPAIEGEDFLQDADDIADVIGDGAHVVAHSYGGLGAMFAAAQRPEAIRSLAVLEPAASTMTSSDAARDLIDAIRSVWDQDLPDEVWLARFLEAVGTDMATLPAEVLEEAAPLVPVLRKGRPAWDREPPVTELAAAAFPKLVVSGGHSEGFEAICDELAEQVEAARAVVDGAGHEIQFTGAPINDVLLNLWAGAE
jgi:pimeloyl-ACP methyl ester carboxylesterase